MRALLQNANSGSAGGAYHAACHLVQERLRKADENPPPRAPLRRTHADPRTIADLIFLVEQVDHVEACRDAFQSIEIERSAHTRVDLEVAGETVSVGRRAVLA